jgi:hypothetical protein
VERSEKKQLALLILVVLVSAAFGMYARKRLGFRSAPLFATGWLSLANLVEQQHSISERLIAYNPPFSSGAIPDHSHLPAVRCPRGKSRVPTRG